MQLRPLGDEDLRAHDVDAGDHLGDRMLDLHAGVDLDEVPLLRVGVDQELDRSGVDVAGGAGDLHGGVAQRAPGLRSERFAAGATSTTFW